MKIAGSYAVPAGQQRTYELLQDPEVLARCMPGVDQLVKSGEAEYAMRMKVVISSVSGLFDGKVRITGQNFPERFRLIVEGGGKIGFLKGDGLLTLVPDSGFTTVNYEGDVQVGGTIAGVGQRLLDATARMIIKKFFERLTNAATAAATGTKAGPD